jgi:hypothetical protein
VTLLGCFFGFHAVHAKSGKALSMHNHCIGEDVVLKLRLKIENTFSCTALWIDSQ